MNENGKGMYIAIDLKSFYASVECVERGHDPLDVSLVVADPTRTDKTICLAVSPALKSFGVPGRPRLFEVVQQVSLINGQRKYSCPGWKLSGKSCSASELRGNPRLALDYIVAPPQMAKYMEYSTRIYSIYLRYIAPEDIHIYSVDEVFIDAGKYTALYGMDAHGLAMMLVREVLKETKITATAGVGTNMYLAKVAMDRGRRYIGRIYVDHYGRMAPAPAHGSINLKEPTASTKAIMEAMRTLFDRVTDAALSVRRITVTAARVVSEEAYEAGKNAVQELDLFADPVAEARKERQRQYAKKEKALQRAVLAIKEKYGKNAMLRGMNFLPGATAIERNGQVGGHRA